MKILIISPSYWPAFQYGGPIQSLHLLAKNLSEQNVNVSVYTTTAGQADNKSYNETIDGVNVNYYSYFKQLDFLGDTGWHFSIQLVNALRSNLKRFDIVYILSIWNFTTAAAAYYCRKFKIPYIISPRGQLYEYVINKKAWKKYPYYKLISKRDLIRANAVHYTTNHEYNNVHKRLNLKNQYIITPNGLDLSEYQSLPNKFEFVDIYPHLKNKKLILFLGRLNWKKGLDILIDSFNDYLKLDDKVHLVIAGNDEDSYKKELISKLDYLKIDYKDFNLPKGSRKNSSKEARITFTGYLNNDIKKKALVDSDIFVLPSYSENFGMSVIESMACGTPILISDNVGVSDQILKNNAGVVVECNIKKLTIKLKELMEDQKLKEVISKNARIMVKNEFDMGKISKLMINKFSDIINKK